MCIYKKVFVMPSKFRKKFASLVCAIIPHKNTRSMVRDFIEMPDVKNRICRMMRGAKMWRTERNLLQSGYKFPHALAVVAIMKNEGPYLREWIEFHKLVGVEKFYLYNNDSSDDTSEILKPYIESGLVDLIDFPGDKRQVPAYNDCIERHKMDTRWLAVIDLDEFIVPDACGNTIGDMLQNIKDNVSQIFIRWVMYGSSGHDKKPDGLVAENFIMRGAKLTWHYKAIVNPRLVHEMDCHRHNVAKKTIEQPVKQIRINHYHCKSWEEYSKRAARGSAYKGQKVGAVRYTREFFDARDTNDVTDRIMDKYLSQLKKNLRK